MTAPLTIKEEAIAEIKYLCDESSKIKEQFDAKEIFLKKIGLVTLAAAAIFGCMCIRDVILTITQRSFIHLSLAALSCTGVGIMSGFIFRDLKPRYENISYLSEAFSSSFHCNVMHLANAWESDKNLDIIIQIENYFVSNRQEDTKGHYVWFSYFPDKKRTVLALANILVIQLSLDLLALPKEGKKIDTLRKYLALSSLSPRTKTKIEEIASFIQSHPNLIYKKWLCLSLLDNFDPEATPLKP